MFAAWFSCFRTGSNERRKQSRRSRGALCSVNALNLWTQPGGSTLSHSPEKARRAAQVGTSSPAKARGSARLRLSFEEIKETWDSAASQKQERRRHTQVRRAPTSKGTGNSVAYLAGMAAWVRSVIRRCRQQQLFHGPPQQFQIITANAQGERSGPGKADSPFRGATISPQRPGSGSSDRLTRRTLSLGGPGDSKVVQTSQWLDDLRQRFGRPRASGELENQPPATAGSGAAAAQTPAAEPSPPRSAPDAAVLAAALAVRLQASPSERLLRCGYRPPRHSSCAPCLHVHSMSKHSGICLQHDQQPSSAVSNNPPSCLISILYKRLFIVGIWRRCSADSPAAGPRGSPQRSGRATADATHPAGWCSLQHDGSRTATDSASPARRHGQSAPLSDVSLTPPRRGTLLTAGGSRVRHHTSGSAATPITGSGLQHSSASRSGTGGRSGGTASKTLMAPGSGGSELSLIEKAVVVSVGILAYPFMRAPPLSDGGSTVAVERRESEAGAGQQEAGSAQQQEVGQDRSEGSAQDALMPISNLAARLTDAAGPPGGGASGGGSSAETAGMAEAAADVFSATATFSTAAARSAGGAAAVGSESGGSMATGAGGIAAESSGASPIPRQPLAETQLGGYGKQELSGCDGRTTPPPASPLLGGPAVADVAAATEAAAPAAVDTPYGRTLRATYGSIPAAAAEDAFDAAVAAAMSEVAGDSPGSSAAATISDSAAAGCEVSEAKPAASAEQDAQAAPAAADRAATAVAAATLGRSLSGRRGTLASMPSIPEAAADTHAIKGERRVKFPQRLLWLHILACAIDFLSETTSVASDCCPAADEMK